LETSRQSYWVAKRALGAEAEHIGNQ
jgi:hypothetical protein